MDTYAAQMESSIGNGLHSNRKRGLLSGPIPIVTLALFVLALSIAFPYGIGVAVFAWMIALAGALAGAGFATYLLLKEALGKTMIFGYSPSAAYLAGKKTKKPGNSRQA
jgi:hypothetical protein